MVSNAHWVCYQVLGEGNPICYNVTLHGSCVDSTYQHFHFLFNYVWYKIAEKGISQSCDRLVQIQENNCIFVSMYFGISVFVSFGISVFVFFGISVFVFFGISVFVFLGISVFVFLCFWGRRGYILLESCANSGKKGQGHLICKDHPTSTDKQGSFKYTLMTPTQTDKREML